MDHLPSDVITHILSFLPGEEVTRFNQLNRSTRDIITTYRCSLKYPEITLKLSDGNFFSNNDVKIVLNLQFHNTFSRITIDFSSPKAIFVDKTVGSRKFVDFLSPFFKRKDGDRSLFDLLDFIFERCVVASLRLEGLSKPYGISALSEAVNRSHARVFTVTIHHTDFANDNLCALLKTIADDKRKESPSLYIFDKLGFKTAWASNLKRINVVSSFYESASVFVRIKRTHGVIEQILKGWRSDPFKKFFFDLFIEIYNGNHDLHNLDADVRRLEEMFEIIDETGNFFEFCPPSRTEETASVWLEDIETGKKLKLHQKLIRRSMEEKYDHDGLVQMSITVLDE